MAKGITVTSSIITISGSTTESGANTFTQEQVPLSLDILGREVLLVYAIDLNVLSPDAQAATNTDVRASMSTTTRTSIGTIASPNVLGFCKMAVQAAGFVDGGVAFQEISPDTPVANALDYVGIVSTNDFFIQVKGTANGNAKGVNWRVWCARAKVTADIYAALVQGEALSA